MHFSWMSRCVPKVSIDREDLTIDQDRYRELLRAWRMWNDMKIRRWFGFTDEGQDIGKGDLAYFCPACPQVNVNISNKWKEDPNQ